jgi:hypothetical protein
MEAISPSRLSHCLVVSYAKQNKPDVGISARSVSLRYFFSLTVMGHKSSFVLLRTSNMPGT